MRDLEGISSKHGVHISAVLLLCVHFQLNGGTSSWEGLLSSSGLSAADARSASTAFHLEGWYNADTGIFAPPGIENSAPLAFSGPPLPSLERKWQVLWQSVTGQPVSGSSLMGGIARYLHARGKALPEPNEGLIRICGDARDAYSVNTFLDDIARYLQDMHAVISLDIKITPELRSSIESLRHAYSRHIPGQISNNVYIFTYLAAKGVVPDDVTRSLKSDPGPLWVEACLRLSDARRSGHRTSGIKLEALA